MPPDPPAAETPPAAPDPGPTEPETEARFEMTSSCVDAGAAMCTPPPRFVSELCLRSSQDLALAMFRAGTPWKRAFVRHDLDAWYTGARHAAPARLEQGEEVLILMNRTGSSGIQVGGGNYDVYRWNGRCASVMADEVSFDRPSFPKTAPIAWERLNDETQSGLLGDRSIQLRKDLYRRSCRDDGLAPACLDAREALTALIAKRVRQASTMP